MMRAWLLLLMVPSVCLAQQYNIPFAPRARGQLFTEDCVTAIDAAWNDVSSGGAAWVVDAGECVGTVAAVNEEPSMIQGPLDTTEEFCSFEIKQIHTTSVKVGCIFRSPVSPGGVHYHLFWNQRFGHWAVENHDSGHVFQDEVKGIDDCGCGTWTDLIATDWPAATLTGTSDSTAFSFWNDIGVADPQDPSAWGTATCECDAAEVDAVVDAAGFTLVESAGSCGPEASVDVNDATTEPNILDFACGDIP